MTLFLLGATAKAGTAVLVQSLERGHLVTAFVRTRSKILARHSNLTVVQGDARSPDCSHRSRTRSIRPRHRWHFSVGAKPWDQTTTRAN
jgi:nucleoside-diphosphate-sugar epimerase